MENSQKIVACSNCFKDKGLRLDANSIGNSNNDLPECPKCNSVTGNQLNVDQLEELAHRFFVWGSINKCDYGAAPVVQFNKKQSTSISLTDDLKHDVSIFEELLEIGFFHYGPRLWMIGEVQPLKALQKPDSFHEVVETIITKYPAKILGPDTSFYRVRKAPKNPNDPSEYDSPPEELAGEGRLDSAGEPVLYTSPDLETCVHECRVTAEDDLYVATLRPTRTLKLLDLSVTIQEDTTEFESLDISINMLFLASKHSYKITQKVATIVRERDYDGVIYPSYFSLLRLGIMPFKTVYGIPIKKIAQYKGINFSETIPNIAIFGRPVSDCIVEVSCINRLIINQVQYNFHFGPASV